MKKLLKEKKGMTLAELMVSLVLLGILGTLCLAALGTYTENYNHINSLNRAHDVSDAMFKSIQKQVNNADSIIWEDPAAGVTGTADGGDALFMQMGGYPAYVRQVSASAPYALGGGTTGKWVSIRYDNAAYIADGGEEISNRELAPSEDSSFGFRVRELKFEKVPASNGYSKAEQMVKVTLTLENAKGIAYTASQVMECLGNARGLYGNAGETGAMASSIVVEKRLHTAGGSVYLGGMVKPGQELVYEITVRNEGSAGAKVQLVELPGFLLSDTAPFVLPAGASKTVTATHTVGTAESSITNIVTAQIQDEDGTALPDVLADFGPVPVENTGFSVEKKIVEVDGLPVTVPPATVKNGAVITYELLVKNNGNKDLANIRVRDTLTVNGKEDALTSGPSEYVIPSLAAYTDYPQTVTYRVKDGVSGKLVNTVTAYQEAKPADKKTASVSTEIDSGFNFNVTKSLHDYSITDQTGNHKDFEYKGERILQKPGETLTLNYYIDVLNTGNEPLKDLRVEDRLAVDEGEPGLVTAEAMGGQEEILPGATRTFKVTVTFRDKIPNKLTNIAKVSAEGVPGSREAQCVTLLEDVEGMRITKAILADNGKPVTELEDVEIGSKVIFPITIQNTGNATMTVETLRDLMEIGGVPAVGGNEPQFTVTQNGGTLQVPFLIEKGQTKQFYASYTLKDKDGGKEIVNRVQAQTAQKLVETSNQVSLTVRVMPPVVDDATWPSDADFEEQDKESGGGSQCYFEQGNIVSWIKDGVKHYYIGASRDLTGVRIKKGQTPEDFEGYYVRIDSNLGEIIPGQSVSLKRGELFEYMGKYYVYVSALQPNWEPAGTVPQDWNPTILDSSGNNQYAVEVKLLTNQHWTK